MRSRRPSRARDRALVLLIAGVALLMPPIAQMFHVDGKIASVPTTMIYLFLVWAGLIVLAYRLARPLADMDGTDGEDR